MGVLAWCDMCVLQLSDLALERAVHGFILQLLGDDVSLRVRVFPRGDEPMRLLVAVRSNFCFFLCFPPDFEIFWLCFSSRMRHESYYSVEFIVLSVRCCPV
jgi:hypothetical protein